MSEQIEPTEEQRSAAAGFYSREGSLAGHVADWVETGDGADDVDIDVVDFAQLLAEREAKLRARVAELEGSTASTSHEQEALHYLDRLHIAARGWDAARDLASVFASRDATAEPRLAKRVAEHLADIKALRDLLREARRHLEGRLMRTGTGLLDDIDAVLAGASAFASSSTTEEPK